MRVSRSVIRTLFITVIGVLLATSIAAEANSTNLSNNNIAVPTPQAAAIPLLIPSPPSINAKGYVLIDVNSGHIIASKNAEQRMPPASLTKLMTLYIIANSLHNGQIELNN